VPRGLEKIEKLAKEAKARSDAYVSGEGFNRALILKDGQTCRGPLPGGGLGHLVPLRAPAAQEARPAVLRHGPLPGPAVLRGRGEGYVEGSKPCRGCELSDVGRPTRVIVNFIRYDEPKLVRDAKGDAVKENGQYKFDGVEPALVVCNFATGVGSRLAFLESSTASGSPTTSARSTRRATRTTPS
jgi:hypothetical protein